MPMADEAMKSRVFFICFRFLMQKYEYSLEYTNNTDIFFAMWRSCRIIIQIMLQFTYRSL